MKRSEFYRTLRHMENIRERSYEAENDAEALSLDAEYGALAASIRPYTSGAAKLEEDTDPEAAAREARLFGAAR